MINTNTSGTIKSLVGTDINGIKSIEYIGRFKTDPVWGGYLAINIPHPLSEIDMILFFGHNNQAGSTSTMRGVNMFPKEAWDPEFATSTGTIDLYQYRNNGEQESTQHTTTDVYKYTVNPVLGYSGSMTVQFPMDPTSTKIYVYFSVYPYTWANNFRLFTVQLNNAA